MSKEPKSIHPTGVWSLTAPSPFVFSSGSVHDSTGRKGFGSFSTNWLPFPVNLVSFVVAIVVISCYIGGTFDPSTVYQAESGQDLTVPTLSLRSCARQRPQGTVDWLAGGPGGSRNPSGNFWLF